MPRSMTLTWMDNAVPPKLPPHVKLVRNPAGVPYYYLMLHRGTAKQSKAIRLPDDPRSPEFWSAYSAAIGQPIPAQKTNTFEALIAAWHQSPEWKGLGDGTRQEWTRHCLRIMDWWGELEVKGISPKHVLAFRDAYAETPATANNMLRCLSSMLGWSVPRDWRPDNPCREVKKLASGEGYAPWPWEVIEAAKLELRPDLWWVVAVALYTGQRLGDCLVMKWSAISANGLIQVKQSKTKKALLIPLHSNLRAVLEAIPRRAVTILTNTDGTPWTDDGFQSSWNKYRPAIVKENDLVFHGLRKSAVVFLLEAGATDAEVGAVTGQSRQMVEHYAKQVSQQKLAASAILKWQNSQLQ